MDAAREHPHCSSRALIVQVVGSHELMMLCGAGVAAVFIRRFPTVLAVRAVHVPIDPCLSEYARGRF